MNRFLTRLVMAAALLLIPALASARSGLPESQGPVALGGSVNFGNQ